jgi:hypothetical protein
MEGTASATGNLAQYIKRGDAPWGPPGAFESASRTERDERGNPKWLTYARYIGEPS